MWTRRANFLTDKISNIVGIDLSGQRHRRRRSVVGSGHDNTVTGSGTTSATATGMPQYK